MFRRFRRFQGTPGSTKALTAESATVPVQEQGEEGIMGEISDLLQQKAGLSPEQSQQVEQIVVDHIKSKVPAEFQGMLGSVLGGDSADGQAAPSGGLGGLLGEASSLFGKG
jgi:hypothetical protein